MSDPANARPAADWFTKPITRPSDYDRRRLSNQIIWGAIAFVVLVIWRAPEAGGMIFNLGIGIALLAVYPTVRWARTMDYNYPFFEIFIGTHLTTYAVPLIMDTDHKLLFSTAVVEQSAWNVVLFEAAALVAFYSIRIRPKTTDFWTKSILRTFNPDLLTGSLALTTIYTLVVNYFWFPPAAIAGILRAVSFGITTSSIFILMMMWGQKTLPARDQLLATLCMAVQFLVLSASLVMRSGASLIIIGMIGFFFGSRRVPWVGLLMCFSIFAVLHTGKYEMRGKYWFGNSSKVLTITDLPAFYEEWFTAGLSGSPEEGNSRSEVLVERTSLIQMLCLVVDQTPSQREFMNGETYSYILGQFVPRFLWPNKPRGHVSTYALAIHYGLQDEAATESTTIAFGLLPEAYANFGTTGSILLGWVMGAFYRLLTRWSLHSPMFSFPGLLVILITAWSFQTEMTLAAWIGSLSQAVIALIGGIYFATRFLRLGG